MPRLSNKRPVPLCEKLLNGSECAGCNYSHDIGYHVKQIWVQRISSKKPRLCYPFIYGGFCERVYCPYHHDKEFQNAYRKDKSISALSKAAMQKKDIYSDHHQAIQNSSEIDPWTSPIDIWDTILDEKCVLIPAADSATTLDLLMRQTSLDEARTQHQTSPNAPSAEHQSKTKRSKRKPKSKKKKRNNIKKCNDSPADVDSSPIDENSVMTDALVQFPRLSKAQPNPNPYGWNTSRLNIKPNPYAKKTYITEEMDSSNTWTVLHEWPVNPLFKVPEEPESSAESHPYWEISRQQYKLQAAIDAKARRNIVRHIPQKPEEKLCSEQQPTELTKTSTQFNDLPYELRKEIWEYAAWDMVRDDMNRAVKIHINRDIPEDPVLLSDYSVPPLLEVCQLSRQVALKHYEVAFGTERNKNPIYYNFSTSVLFLCNKSYEDLPWMVSNHFHSHFKRVKRLVLPLRDLVYQKAIGIAERCYLAIARLRRLVNITFLVARIPENACYCDDKRRLRYEREIQENIDRLWAERYTKEPPRVHIEPVPENLAKNWGIRDLGYTW
ncbi:hypothetical protein F5884DRAFT_774801 [Xylogone sp. PMI_703]|nr:hypothetical protein F5884DRAFT_774801 [Xylogone sp. PMI_703]